MPAPAEDCPPRHESQETSLEGRPGSGPSLVSHGRVCRPPHHVHVDTLLVKQVLDHLFVRVVHKSERSIWTLSTLAIVRFEGACEGVRGSSVVTRRRGWRLEHKSATHMSLVLQSWISSVSLNATTRDDPASEVRYRTNCAKPNGESPNEIVSSSSPERGDAPSTTRGGCACPSSSS
jgi:hypothetical protein